MVEHHHGDYSDDEFLDRAAELAALGPAGDPNPQVGALIVDAAGRVVGEGYHRGAGTDHAEVVALRAAGPRAREATAYVTLEPCAHTGRTGPCATALVAAGIARVVYGQADPNPAAAGGARLLEAAGVVVTASPRNHACGRLNREWTVAMRRGWPFVTWKFAATLDGRSAAPDGSSQWITGAAARADVQRLRARCGAIIVGTGTVLADDPWLTVRDSSGRPAARQPIRAIFGRRELPASARVLDPAAPTLRFPGPDLAAELRALGDLGVRHAWLEGGPTLAAAFLRAGLVDEIVAYLAPALLGGGSAAVGDLDITAITAATRLDLTDVALIENDLRLTARPR